MQTTINVNLSIDELQNLIAGEISQALQKHLPERTNQQDERDELMKIQEVADLFKVSKVTIYDWKKQGKIPFHRIARKVYFKRSEIMQALKKIGV